MPEFGSYAHGTPCWVDVTTPDLERTNGFYGALFGWEPHDQGEEAGHYTMYTLRGKNVAAASPPPPSQEGLPPHWTTYLASDDVDETVGRIRAAGGSVFMEPFDVFDSGRMTIAADPTGPTFGVWEAGTHVGAQLANEHGTLVWNECHSPDPERASEFYRDAFGYTVEATEMGGPVPYRALQVDGRSVAGVWSLQEGEPPSWATIFAVDACDAAVARARELGAQVVVDPFDIPSVGRYSVLADPVGAVLGVLAPPA